jgi:hypothetical protein
MRTDLPHPEEHMSLATSRPRRSLALVAGVALSATLLAACGSSSSGKKAAAPSPARPAS